MRLGATISGAPRLPRTYVPRFRLWKQLDRTTQDAITLVVAPAGAGKTLAASGWLRQRDPDREGVWLDGDASCEPERLARLLAPSSCSREAPPLLVIDDAHLLPAASLRLIDQRLNDEPDTLRLLLLSRWDLPLTRLVPELLGHYSALRGDMLRLDDEETATLVKAHVPNASSDVIDAISAYAQGWCAPAVLTARVVAASPDPGAAARKYARTDGRVADHVVSEVFSALNPAERHLLLCVGREETVTAATAAHLCHDVRAGETLSRLEATGLLVIRTGDSTSTADFPRESEACYRIHPLLTEVVHRRLVNGGVDVSRARATVSRAVRLDLARGDGARAFDRLVAVHEVEQAAELLADEGVTMVMRGEGPAIAAFVDRHLEVVEARPRTWFAIALDRWVSDDVGPARAWMDLVLDPDVPGPTGDDDSAMHACLRLMRARLGAESVEAAVTHAELIVAEWRCSHQHVWPQLLTELGILQNWIGELTQAEANLTRAIELCRLRGLTSLAATATSHLACTQLMAGRERAAVEVATEALSLLAVALPSHPPLVGTRATLALLLGGLVDLPWPSEAIRAPDKPSATPDTDPCLRFWLRVRDARLALLSGSAGDAERILTTPVQASVTEERLPDHLHVVILIEHAFLAALASDRDALRRLEQRLLTLAAHGEAALVRGLLADLEGDRCSATTAFETAAEESTYAQPPCRALALVCHAQLLDAEGRTSMALDRLRQAVQATEVRRNAVPFLGWIRQGSPAGPLLGRLNRHDGPLATPWLEQLAAANDGQADASSKFAPSTATPRERSAGDDVIVRPSLSPREREVLHELARGATYCDIAASLYVSENTVKTHVSSLYGKLAVSRRSQALAVARSLQLL